MLKLLPTLVSLSTAILPAFAAEPIDVGSRRELFVDDCIIEKIEGDARLELQQPAAQEVALITDKPWEGNICCYFTVFRDKDASGNDICRMYYRGADQDITTRASTHAPVVCYAESKDGIHWTKPNLGLVEFDGSKENNIVWDGAGAAAFAPFKDTNPDCPPEARYKAIAQAHRSGKAWYAVPDEMAAWAFKSPDGIRWTIGDGPLITKGDFDSQNVAFWDPPSEQYRVYHRTRILRKPDGEVIIGGSAAYEGIRSIMTCSSKDFLNWTSWSDPTPLEYSDDLGEQHLYTSAVMSYPRASQILIGFPTRLLPEQGDRVEPILMASRDGQKFKRWDKPVIPEDAPEDRKGNRSNYMAWGLMPAPGNDNEYSVYATEAYRSGPATRLRRFTYRLDGFVALQGGEQGGQLTTVPMKVAGGSLELNYVTRPGGHVRVEIQDAEGRPLPGFAAEDCDPLTGDEIAHAASWKGNTSGPFADRPIHVRLDVKDADVYSFKFN